MTVLTCNLRREGKSIERQLRNLEQKLLRASVRRIILPDDFLYGNMLKQLRPVDPIQLYRGRADQLVLKALEWKQVHPEEATVALAGPQLCPEICAAANLLCRSVRRLRIDVPGVKGEAFARSLRREFGIGLLPSSARVDVSAAFGPSCEEVDIRLYGNCGIRLRAADVNLPEEIEQPVLQLLWEQGRIRREDLQVINIP